MINEDERLAIFEVISLMFAEMEQIKTRVEAIEARQKTIEHALDLDYDKVNDQRG